jgi:hypothetical protein
VKRGRKKGQATATSAAGLVIVIVLIIVFYLLFIPPDVRRDILEGDGSLQQDGGSSINETLLRENPGILDTFDKEDVEHLIPSVNLFETRYAAVLVEEPQVVVKNSWFNKREENITFTIEDLKNTNNVLLSFVAREYRGELRIAVNGEEVFFGPLSSANIEPIRIRKDFLKQGKNSIEVSASSVGAKFWSSNVFVLEEFKVTADITDVSEQLSKNIFIVSATEKTNAQRVTLSFVPECTLGTVGTLEALINSQVVYSAVPDCGSGTKVEINPDILRQRENTLVFKTDKGNYLIDLIKVTTQMKDAVHPIYYFDIDEEDFEEILKHDVILRVVFVDDLEIKQGKFIINGRETGLYQKERIYEKKINDFLVEGNNAIKIVPESRLEIVKLEVVVEN